MIALATALISAGIVVGILLLSDSFGPKSPSLSAKANFLAGERVAPPPETRLDMVRSALGSLLGSLEASAARPGSADAVADRAADLAVSAVERQRWHTERLYWMAGSAALSAAVAMLFRFVVGSGSGAGTEANWSLLAVVSLMPLGAVGGWLVAERLLISRADSARVVFRHAVAVYLELATIAMAGGSGPAEAIRTAANLGEGWAFARIRSVLADAELRQLSPYRALDELGAKLGVVELRDAGSALALAESTGASTRTTLEIKSAKATAVLMRAEEAKAESRSIAMSLPSVLMLCGFLLFVMYPFIAALLETTR